MKTYPFRLDGKSILITGASSGIGRTTAIECATMGASLCYLVARNQENLTETASLMKNSCQSVIIPMDITDHTVYPELINLISVLDGVVFNAGINKMQLLQFNKKKDIDNIFSVNCYAPILLLKELVKKRKLSNSSSIVFTASISGYSNVSAANSLYGASKSALTAYMKYAALELAHKGIRCNAVHPGRIETPFLNNSLIDEETTKADITKYPLGRYGKPEEVAWSIIYLLSDASQWITGSDIVIDGGRSLI